MIQPIVRSDAPITLIGGGYVGPRDLDTALRLAPGLVAADGGAEAAMARGHVPVATIGDFDSLPDAVRHLLPAHTLHEVAEQTSTDFEKALMRIDAPLVLGVGFCGGRMDHQLAALHGLMAHAHRACILIGEREVLFHTPPDFALDLPEGDTVSLFPLGPVTGRSDGLKWPIAGLELKPGLRIGTSNQSMGGRMALELADRGLITCLPRARLAEVTQALLDLGQGRGLWPVL